MEDTRPELVLNAQAALGESPVWDEKTRKLVWVDIPRQSVHWFDLENGTDQSVNVGRPVSGVAPASSGGLAIGAADGFWLLKEDGSLEPIAPCEADKPENRMNDAKCDSHGRYWGGTIALDLTRGAGSLYRLDADRSLHQVLTGLWVPNGMAWSPDDSTFYFIDSFEYCVFAFDFDAQHGTLSNQRKFADIPEEDGLADGMTVDAEGGVWVALFGGWSLRRYTPQGKLDAVLKMPVSQVTSCAFGGDDLSDFYITSATNTVTGTLSPEQRREQPLAGGIFKCRVGVKGLPPRVYGIS